MDDPETMENITNKSPSPSKKKKSNVKRMNTCAKFGVLDCSCCQEITKPNAADNNETIVHDESDQIDLKPIVKNEEVCSQEQLYLPSTSTVTSADVQSYIDSAAADINFDEEDLIMKELEFKEQLKKLMKTEPLSTAAVPEEEEIDVVNGSPENFSFSTNEEEIIEQRETSTTTVFDTTVESVQIDRDSNVFVNETINSAFDEVVPQCENIGSDTENMDEEIDVVNETPVIVIQKRSRTLPDLEIQPLIEEEIDVVNEIDENAPLSTLITRNTATPKRKRRKLHRNPVIEDEIIDVVNLTEDTPNLASLSTALVNSNRNIIKKRKDKHRNVMNVVNSNRDDSIIEITDSPIAPKVISEVINIDDDELSQNNADSPQKGPSLGACPVCMEEFTKCEIMSTMCGHVFCAMCIKTVIKTTKKCPKCRKHLTLKSIHPLFF